MKLNFSMINLGVHNLVASVGFYEGGLGFPRMDLQSEVAFFTLNGTWLGLYGREALATDAKVLPEGSGFESFALAHNVCSKSEGDEAMSMALEVGATLCEGAREGFWGRVQWLLQRTVWPPMGDCTQSIIFWVGPNGQ